MAKTKVRFKITGLEFEFEGDRENLPAAASGVAQQLAGMLEAPVIVNGQNTNPKLVESTTVNQADSNATKRRSRNGRSKSKSSSGATDAKNNAAIDFTHSPLRFGNPTTEWITADKALWLLFCLEQEAGVKEASAGAIAETFNKHFRQAKTIRPSNVSRDFGKMKKNAPYLVGEDTTKDPTMWYLTDPGKDHVRSLVAGVLSGGTDGNEG